jgi:hypothetical protein
MEFGNGTKYKTTVVNSKHNPCSVFMKSRTDINKSVSSHAGRFEHLIKML